MRKLLALAVVGIALGGAVAAVTSNGGDGGGSGELTPIAHSVEAAADAGSFRLAMAMEMELPGVGSFSMTGDGEFDESGQAGRMTMRMSGIPELGTLEMEVVLVGETMYMNMGELASALGAPTPWFSIDLADIPGASDLLGGGGGLGANDPTQFLEMLRGAGKADVVGHEDVRGVSTTHYRARVNVEDAIAAAPKDQRDALRSMMESLSASSGLDLAGIEFPVEVWIDDQGLPRRMEMTMDFGSVGIPDVPSGTSVTVTVEFYDFGVDVNVEPPPADQVTDLTELAGI